VVHRGPLVHAKAVKTFWGSVFIYADCRI
jgi:hypothetical protein